MLKLTLVKHFQGYYDCCKIFNRNNFKLSYSCMPRINNVIRKHNTKIMKDAAPSAIKICKCRPKTDFHVDGNCYSECLI